MGHAALRRAGGALPAAQRPLAVERLPAVARAAGRPGLPHRLLRRRVGGARADGGVRMATRGAVRGAVRGRGDAADPAAARTRRARVTLGIIAAYFIAVLVIGGFSHRLFQRTSEDYFVASRSLGPALLLLNLFGANMTAFAVLGASGEAYTSGIGVFALMGSSSALVIPLVFYFVGTRVWELGKRRGYLSPVQFFRERYGSDGLGLLLFVVLNALLIPYLLIGLAGGGIALAQLTGGAVPKWAGSLIIVAVVLGYVAYGGMRGAIWVNGFQALLLLLLGGVASWVIVHQLGGLESAMQRLGAVHPELLVR